MPSMSHYLSTRSYGHLMVPALQRPAQTACRKSGVFHKQGERIISRSYNRPVSLSFGSGDVNGGTISMRYRFVTSMSAGLMNSRPTGLHHYSNLSEQQNATRE